MKKKKNFRGGQSARFHRATSYTGRLPVLHSGAGSRPAVARRKTIEEFRCCRRYERGVKKIK